jgi:uncharacterized membrane protein YhaH (DUF805 family)
MSNGEWFYLESGRELGPVTQERLIPLLRKLPPGTLVWRDGLAEWMKAEEVPEIAALLAAPPPSVPSLPPRTSRPPERRPAPSPYGRPAASPVPSGEPETWNPFVLLPRCFQWGGRFSRAEYAIAYFSNLVLAFCVIFGLAIVAGVLGSGKSEAAAGVVGLFIMVWTLVAVVISLGAGLRRLHDLDKPGWWILGFFAPCVNLVMLLYLLFAPGQTEGPSSAMPVLVIVAALLVLAVPAIGIIAAIAIPSLLRARVAANESMAIGDIRTVISGQAAYQSISGGFYASRLECLTRPGDCVANYTGPQMLDPGTAASPKNGYVRQFVPSPLVRGSDTSTSGYAFLAYPIKVGQTGMRSFCGDSSGRICYDPQAGMDLVETAGTEVQCSMRCMTLP